MKLSLTTLCLFVVACACACVYAEERKSSNYYTAIVNGDKLQIQNVKDETGVAWSYYSNDMETMGWANLNIQTNPAFSDSVQMYAAGYLEGYISSDLIYANYENIMAGEWNTTAFPTEFQAWIDKNTQYMMNSTSANPSDPYWSHISLVWQQLVGMVDGYAAANNDPKKALSITDFLIINMDGDLEDILPALNISAGPTAELNWDDDDSVALYHVRNMRCSALVKLADDLSEIYTGHTTWIGYYEMTRMFKTYNFSLSTAGTESQVVMFSGYPGVLSSLDDYYVLDSGLIVTETTNGVMNLTLYESFTAESVLSWIRVIVANRMAKSGSEWVSIFSQFNSGTYNNQWIIVDNNKLDKGVRVNKGALYILEQIPGYIFAEDVTDMLALGYWGSFNVPYSEYVYNVSGFAKYAEKYGRFFTYENNPRAEIFRRDAGKVSDMDSMKTMMRYNDWEKDKLSDKNAGYAISSRFDLCPKQSSVPFLERMPAGGVDSKVANTKMGLSMECYAQSGPTHDQQPPFEYKGEWKDLPHAGQPEKWNFDWELMDTKL